MSSGRISFLLIVALAVCCLPAAAQISSIDPNQIQTNGTAQVFQPGEGGPFIIQLNPDLVGQAGSGWWTSDQSVSAGFTSVFTFQAPHSGFPADGLAFLIQNCVFACDGGPLFALGIGGGSLAYDGIDNSLAIEFDTFQNGENNDPNANHVAIQSCGTGFNTVMHNVACGGDGPNSTLGITAMPGINITDGNPHMVILQYDPGVGDGQGQLGVYVDNGSVPILAVPVQLDQLLSLNQNEDGTGHAYVGFTGATGAFTEENDILSWTFTPGNSLEPTTITQGLIPGPGDHFTNFVFGSYNQKFEYTNANNGDQVSVTAVPSSPASVNTLIDHSFPNAQCVTYNGTGGQCVIFQVMCSQTTGSDCTTLPNTVYLNYNTSQQVTTPCLLKSEDLGATWVNIFTGFSELRFDPVTSGRGNGFSWFVAAQSCSPPMPANQLRGTNCNGSYTGVFHGNLTISSGQSCIFTNGGVAGNVTQNGGSFVLQGHSSITGNLTVRGGSLYVNGSTISGNLQISGPTSFAIGTNVTVSGNVLVQSVPATGGTNQVCGVTTPGNITVQQSATSTQIGTTNPSICPGNTTSGNLTVQTNSGATTVDSNSVRGNLYDLNNTGATDVSSNQVNSNLQCSGNSSITGGGNTAKKKLGQCSAF
jgi:hypothetical protein